MDTSDIVPTIYNRAIDAIPALLKALDIRADSITGFARHTAQLLAEGTSLALGKTTLAASSCQLLALALRLCAPSTDRREVGLHIGNIILLDGNHFRRLCEDNRAPSYSALNVAVDLADVALVKSLANRHPMVSYFGKWTDFTMSDRPNPPDRLDELPFEDELDLMRAIVPDVSVVAVTATQVPATQKISFAAVFPDRRAAFTFREAQMFYSDKIGEEATWHSAPLSLVAGAQVRRDSCGKVCSLIPRLHSTSNSVSR